MCPREEEAQSIKRRRLAGFALLMAAFAVVHAVESRWGPARRTHVVSTSIVVPGPPSAVWDALKAFDTLDGPLPPLLRLGLPVPERCTLEKPAVGAKRVCYFGAGRIEQRVSAWDPPRRMELEIVEVDLPGRGWFGFTGASYALSEEGDGTRVTRTTTVTSELRPGWCWEQIERMGVQAEHEYLLGEIGRRVRR